MNAENSPASDPLNEFWPANIQVSEETSRNLDLLGQLATQMSLSQWFEIRVGDRISSCSPQLKLAASPQLAALNRLVLKENSLVVVQESSEALPFKFLAGTPILAREGTVTGTLCVVNEAVIDFGHQHGQALVTLAQQIFTALESHVQREALKIAQYELELAYSSLARMHSRAARDQDKMIDIDRLASAGRMVSEVLHEINNPLAALQLESDLIEELVKAPDLELTNLEEISTQLKSTVQYMCQVVSSMRVFATDGSSLKAEELSLSAIFGQLKQIFDRRFKSHNIQLLVDALPSEVVVQSRSNQIAQVLVNLIKNAADAVEDLGERWIRLSARVDGTFTEISVTDSGAGISIEVEGRLFEPFYTTKAAGKGTGLGLSISRKIIAAHGGSILVDRDCPNTRFVVRLPILSK